jgi:hypothetical protein
MLAPFTSQWVQGAARCDDRSASAILPHITSRINVDALNQHLGIDDVTKRQVTIRERIERDFSPHALTAQQRRDCVYLQALIGAVALRLTDFCPDCRELNGALNKLDEATYWAHEAIARHPRTGTGL